MKLLFYCLCLFQLGRGSGVRLAGGGHATDDIKGDPYDCFLYFSYLNSLAVQFSSWGADSWQYAKLQSTFPKLLIFPNWGLMVWLGLGENVPRSWVSCVSSRFVIVPETYRQGLETTLLPGPCKANGYQLPMTFRIPLHRPTKGPSSDSFFWAVYLSRWQKLVSLRDWKYPILQNE